MKKKLLNYRITRLVLSSIIFVGIISLLLANFKPFFPIYSTRNYNQREVGEPLLGETVVSDCFFTDILPGSIEWQWLTYGRKNTNTVLINFYTQDDPENTVQVVLPASELGDHQFSGVKIPSQFQTTRKVICFDLFSYDATDDNAVTFWHNTEENRPIFRVYPRFGISAFEHTIKNVLTIIKQNY